MPSPERPHSSVVSPPVMELHSPAPPFTTKALEKLPQILVVAAVLAPALHLCSLILSVAYNWFESGGSRGGLIWYPLTNAASTLAYALFECLILLTAAMIVSLARQYLAVQRHGLQHMEMLTAQMKQLSDRLSPMAAASGPAPQSRHLHHATADGQALQPPLSELLHEIRDMSLMTPVQRRQWAERHWAKRKLSHREKIECSILKGQWEVARGLLDELSILLPDDPELAKLDERMANELTERILEDVRNARAEIRHLININSWNDAEDVLATLHRKYPTDGEVKELVAQFNHELEAHHKSQQDRLFVDLARCTEHHHWRAAAALAEEILQRYPLHPLADKLESDLPTLRENAAAEDRREQEHRFRDLLKSGHLREAESLAHSLIEKYPLSPAAAELQKLLPRVEEMIRQNEQVLTGGRA